MTVSVLIPGLGKEPFDVRRQRRGWGSQRTDQGTYREELATRAWEQHPEGGSEPRDTDPAESAPPAPSPTLIVMTTCHLGPEVAPPRYKLLVARYPRRAPLGTSNQSSWHPNIQREAIKQIGSGVTSVGEAETSIGTWCSEWLRSELWVRIVLWVISVKYVDILIWWYRYTKIVNV